MKINTFKNNLFILEANFVSEETRQGLSQVSEMFSKVLEKFSVYQICCELVAKSERARVVELVDTIDLGSIALGCEGSSPFSSTNFLKVSLEKIVKCFGVLKLARVMENFMKIKSKNNNLVLGSTSNHQHTCIYPLN